MAYAIRTTAEFNEWFAGLTDEEVRALDPKVARLAELGPALGRPHADTLHGSRIANLKELRAKTGRSVLRVAYVMDPSRSALLLIGGNKSGISERRFYKQLIARAEVIYHKYID